MSRKMEMRERPGWNEEDRGHETLCWIWGGNLNASGYGVSARSGRAHRMVYERMVGPVSEGLELDHLCRVRSCVNPAHLEAVTHQENMRRAYAVRWTVVEGLPTAIREARVALGYSQSQLAKRLGVSQALVALWEQAKHEPAPAHLAGLIRLLLAEGFGSVPEPPESRVIGGQRAS